jgi:hypothetical protein
MSYWGTSAPVKLYVKEGDSVTFETQARGAPSQAARVARDNEIVATDKRLREAAKRLGFALFPA